MIRKNSKKYFRETVLAALPKVYYSRNPKLIDDAISILACYIPKGSQKIPIKLKSSLAKYDLQKSSYQELISFLTGKSQLDQDGVSFVKFIEQEILRYAVQEYKKDELYHKTEGYLSDLRGSTPKGIKNTCCYSCGKVLERHDADPPEFGQKHPHYCSKRENSSCFAEWEKQEKKEDKEWQLILRGQRCTNCEIPITFSLDKKLNHIHKRQPFCSDRCWETYRKRFQRQGEPIPGNPQPIPYMKLI